MLGWHWILVTEDADAARTMDLKHVGDALVAVISALKLTPVGVPQLYDGGDRVTGVHLISESHVGIHATGSALRVDLFSCVSFEPDTALKVLQEYFGFEHAEQHFAQRGHHFGDAP